MTLRALFFEARLLLFDDQHGLEFIRGDFIERQFDAQLQGRAQIERPAQELAWFACLRCIEAVERAVIAAATLGRIRAEPWIA